MNLKSIFATAVYVNLLFFIALLFYPVSAKAEEDAGHILRFKPIEKSDIKQLPNSDEMDFTINVDGKKIEFELSDNQTLIRNSQLAKRYTETRFLAGAIKGNPRSWVRLTYQNGLMTGAYFDGDSLFFIETEEAVKKQMHPRDFNFFHQKRIAPETLKGAEQRTVVFNVNDMEKFGSCALDVHTHDDASNSHNFNYNSYVDDLTQLLSTGTASSEIRITLVADVEYVSSSSNASVEMLSELNIADGIFSDQLGITIVAEDTQELSNNESLNSTNPENLLTAFRQLGIPNLGLIHLFTGKNLNGSTAGIAYVGALCNSFAAGVTQRTGSVTALVLTHEIGHNFGAPHDNQGGSACASTSSGFIMNPRIVSSATEFSACSIEQMAPVIDNATNGFNACIVAVRPTAPSITSTANLNAREGQAYQYDNDATVDVSTGPSVSFNLDIAPDGMTIDSAGRIAWAPSSSQLGINPVQVSVQNENGQDSQYFEVNVQANDVVGDFINFQELAFSRFDSQYRFGDVITSVSPFQLELTGNNWQSVPFDYQVTEDTVLEFEFSSNVEAEIHGIALENNNRISADRTFNVYGTQAWGLRPTRYSGNGEPQTITIAVGEFFQGSVNRLVFLVDNDTNITGANSVFNNVRVYESSNNETPPALLLNLNDYSFRAHRNDQDEEGTVSIIEEGAGITLQGNRWRKISLDTLAITPSTVLEFEFKSTAQGEIHGLGFLPGDTLSGGLTFQLFGTQSWGIRDFTYTGDGEFQRFRIPVGEYFGQPFVELVFIMDHDVNNPTGNSTFRNIRFSN